MKKTSLFLSLLAGSLWLLGSCDDIIAKDITDEVPVIVLPAANATIGENPVHFKWNAVEGATKYHLEVVSPSFANIQEFALDSIVTGTNFFFALDSNTYQLRLTALNAGYESQTTSPVTFTIGTSAGVPTDVVVLTLPANNAWENETFDGKFKWDPLTGADHYQFELHRGTSFAGETVDIIPDLESFTAISYDGSVLTEGEYIWGTKAFMEDGTETAYTKRTLHIDKTAPGTVTMNTPVSNQSHYMSTGSSVTFTWTYPQNPGTHPSPVTAILELSETSAFGNIVYSASPAIAGATTMNVNFSDPDLGTGTYYWRIRLVDEAGNVGANPSGGFLLNVLP